ncbi:MAG: hypothetical protein QME42_07495 [bacterium]|nr:hypothetical protein [bacterium]
MKKLLILSLILIFLPITSFSQDKIMEKLNKIEQDISVLKEGQNYINKRIDNLENGLNKRIDDLKDLMLTGFAILFSGMFAVVGFVIWDRRTALAPAVQKIEELNQKEKAVDKVLEVLKSYARKEPRFKEAMQTAGLL